MNAERHVLSRHLKYAEDGYICWCGGRIERLLCCMLDRWEIHVVMIAHRLEFYSGE
jgi:hypothetical protein